MLPWHYKVRSNNSNSINIRWIQYLVHLSYNRPLLNTLLSLQLGHSTLCTFILAFLLPSFAIYTFI
jgi:hypothetical protein